MQSPCVWCGTLVPVTDGDADECPACHHYAHWPKDRCICLRCIAATKVDVLAEQDATPNVKEPIRLAADVLATLRALGIAEYHPTRQIAYLCDVHDSDSHRIGRLQARLTELQSARATSCLERDDPQTFATLTIYGLERATLLDQVVGLAAQLRHMAEVNRGLSQSLIAAAGGSGLEREDAAASLFPGPSPTEDPDGQ